VGNQRHGRGGEGGAGLKDKSKTKDLQSS